MDPRLLKKIDRNTAAQLKTLGIGEKKTIKFKFPTITISREFGCEGVTVTQQLIKKLSTKQYPWVLFHRKLITEISEHDELRKDLTDSIEMENRDLFHQFIDHLLSHKPINLQLYKKMAQTIRILALNGRSVILGTGGAIMTSDIKNTFHVRLQADMDFKSKRVAGEFNISIEEAKKRIISNDRNREEFIYEFTRKDVRDPHHYQLVIDNGSFNAVQIADLIYHSLELRNMLPKV